MMGEFDLTGYLPYLINRAGARIANAFTREARRHGINLQMWRVLAALHHRDGQTVGELSDTTSIEISTLSRVLDQMQGKRLILRRREADDQRAVSIWRTEAGRATTELLLPTALRYEAVALEGFGIKDAALLKTMLRRVYGNLDVLPNAAAPKEKGRAAQTARPVSRTKNQSAAKQ
jgi:DNA-binding MarR family transcriptional regulator